MEEYVKDLVKASGEDEVMGLYDREFHLEKLKFREIQEVRHEAARDGRKEGMKEGKKQERMEIAKNMLNKNINDNTIIEYTGLKKKEIDKFL